jgi:hypothetical protein
VSFVHGLELLVAHALFLPFSALTQSWKLASRPAVIMRSQLLVPQEKLGQLPLLTVYVVPVKGEK